MTTRVLTIRRRGSDLSNIFELLLESGEVAAIVGQAGSGKSRLFAAILGWVEWGDGFEVEAHGKPARTNPLETRASLTSIEGAGGLAGHLTVRENIALMVQLATGQHPNIDDVVSAIRRSDLPDRSMDSKVDDLKPLQHLQVWFAIARVRKSPLVLLDDPLVRLDASEIRQLPSLISDLQAEGIAVLLAVRDLAFAVSYAPMVWRLEDGLLTQVRTDSLATARLRDLLDADSVLGVHETRAEKPPDRTM